MVQLVLSVESDHMTWILASDWSVFLTGQLATYFNDGAIRDCVSETIESV